MCRGCQLCPVPQEEQILTPGPVAGPQEEQLLTPGPVAGPQDIGAPIPAGPSRVFVCVWGGGGVRGGEGGGVYVRGRRASLGRAGRVPVVGSAGARGLWDERAGYCAVS